MDDRFQQIGNPSWRILFNHNIFWCCDLMRPDASPARPSRYREPMSGATTPSALRGGQLFGLRPPKNPADEPGTPMRLAIGR